MSHSSRSPASSDSLKSNKKPKKSMPEAKEIISDPISEFPPELQTKPARSSSLTLRLTLSNASHSSESDTAMEYSDKLEFKKHYRSIITQEMEHVFLAIEQGDQTKLNTLLEKIKITSSLPYIIFMYALIVDKISIAKSLKEKFNIDLNQLDANDMTALHYAAIKNLDRVIKYLVKDFKMNIDIINSNGETPLHLAAQHTEGVDSAVQLLIEDYKADSELLSKTKRNIFHYAALGQQYNTLVYLATSGQVEDKLKNATDARGVTPLQLAVSGNCHIITIQSMVEDCKFDPTIIDHHKRTLLYFALSNQDGSPSSIKEIFKYLIKNCKINVSSRDNQQRTVLHHAALAEKTEVLAWLKQENPKMILLEDENGHTADDLIKIRDSKVSGESKETAPQSRKRKEPESGNEPAATQGREKIFRQNPPASSKEIDEAGEEKIVSGKMKKGQT